MNVKGRMNREPKAQRFDHDASGLSATHVETLPARTKDLEQMTAVRRKNEMMLRTKNAMEERDRRLALFMEVFIILAIGYLVLLAILLVQAFG